MFCPVHIIVCYCFVCTALHTVFTLHSVLRYIRLCCIRFYGAFGFYVAFGSTNKLYNVYTPPPCLSFLTFYDHTFYYGYVVSSVPLKFPFICLHTKQLLHMISTIKKDIYFHASFNVFIFIRYF